MGTSRAAGAAFPARHAAEPRASEQELCEKDLESFRAYLGFEAAKRQLEEYAAYRSANYLYLLFGYRLA